MLTVTVDPKDYQKWMNENVVVLKDSQGKVLGRFLPQVENEGLSVEDDEEMSHEEFQRRLNEGPGRTLPEILHDLEKTS